MRHKPLPPLQRVRELLDYDPLTGIFVWRENRGIRPTYGKIAGRKMGNGYWQITIDGKGYLGHRLAWLHYYGIDPDSQIDHRNLARSDNWIDNLRQATPFQNMQNVTISRKNTSGFKGVCFHKRDRLWQASIGFNGKLKHIGSFRTAEEANAAYNAQAKELFGEFYRKEGS